jgi:hypothetical protein
MTVLAGIAVCLVVGGSIGLFTFGLFDGTTQRGIQNVVDRIKSAYRGS